MPLPAPSTPWPPRAMVAPAAKYAEFSAWYAGDPNQLRDTYQRPTRVDRPAQYRGGATGALARMWWGRPIGDLTRRHDFLHVPLASDICQASADLLFSEPPSITSKDKATQALLDGYADDGLMTLLAEMSEIGAALGDVYLRTTWSDSSGRDGAFLTVVDADQAWPEFRWGQLVAVTFWWELESGTSNTVWRHLERHELDTTGNGIIVHGLYEGTGDNLGRPVPLAEHHATAGLATAVDAEGAITTGSPGLAVQHIPNQTPQRLLRKHPIGRHLGRSDLAGIEGPMDALDEAYSSWMRDLRLGKGRVIAPQYMLQSQGPGRGAILDLDQDVFVGINQPPTVDGSGAGLTLNQFAIRVEEHAKTCHELVKTILRTAGYSAGTFGEDEGGGVRTATEVVSEENRSYRTRDRKIRLVGPRISKALEKTLSVDQALFNKRVNLTERPEVQFGDAVQADTEGIARTSQLLRAAQAASTKTLVQLNHPDWDGTQVDDEVTQILAENSLTVPDFGPTGSEPPETEPVPSDVAGE